jgi:hypothetical protein
VISPERALVLPPIPDGDKYEAQIVQLETIRLNGLSTVDLLKTLLGLVNKLSEDVIHPKSDNASLNTLQKSVDIKSTITDNSTAGSLPLSRLPRMWPEKLRGHQPLLSQHRLDLQFQPSGLLLTREYCANIVLQGRRVSSSFTPGCFTSRFRWIRYCFPQKKDYCSPCGK